jgi:hypothetical protein
MGKDGGMDHVMLPSLLILLAYIYAGAIDQF